MSVVYLPFRGEFGHRVMWHAPWVYQERAKIVCCEPGDECLFPTAKVFIEVPPPPHDRYRSHRSLADAMYLRSLRAKYEETRGPLSGCPENLSSLPRFVPQPREKRGIETDIVICPRRRELAPQRNWPHWHELERELSSNWRVFAAGAKDSSHHTIKCDAAWNYPRHLDATVEAMLSAKMVVSTDTGLAHLAVLCGRPLMIICHGNGYTGPGSNKVQYWRFHAANHMQAPIGFLNHSWAGAGIPFREVAEWMSNTGDVATQSRASTT